MRLHIRIGLHHLGGGGCNTILGFESTPPAPSICGGSVSLTFGILAEDMSELPGFVSSNSFSVIAENSGPLCPTDWDIDVPGYFDGCIYPAYIDADDLSAKTGIEIMNGCGDLSNILISYTDSLILENCIDRRNVAFDSREVIRTYIRSSYRKIHIM